MLVQREFCKVVSDGVIEVTVQDIKGLLLLKPFEAKIFKLKKLEHAGTVKVFDDV